MKARITVTRGELDRRIHSYAAQRKYKIELSERERVKARYANGGYELIWNIVKESDDCHVVELKARCPMLSTVLGGCLLFGLLFLSASLALGTLVVVSVLATWIYIFQILSQRERDFFSSWLSVDAATRGPEPTLLRNAREVARSGGIGQTVQIRAEVSGKSAVPRIFRRVRAREGEILGAIDSYIKRWEGRLLRTAVMPLVGEESSGAGGWRIEASRYISGDPNDVIQVWAWTVERAKEDACRVGFGIRFTDRAKVAMLAAAVWVLGTIVVGMVIGENPHAGSVPFVVWAALVIVCAVVLLALAAMGVLWERDQGRFFRELPELLRIGSDLVICQPPSQDGTTTLKAPLPPDGPGRRLPATEPDNQKVVARVLHTVPPVSAFRVSETVATVEAFLARHSFESSGIARRFVNSSARLTAEVVEIDASTCQLRLESESRRARSFLAVLGVLISVFVFYRIVASAPVLSDLITHAGVAGSTWPLYFLAGGLDRSYVSGLERGEFNVSVLKLAAVAKAVGVRLGALFEGE